MPVPSDDSAPLERIEFVKSRINKSQKKSIPKKDGGCTFNHNAVRVH